MTNIGKHIPLKLIVSIMLLIISACSSSQVSRGSSNQKPLLAEGMLSFEGSIFVATSQPSPGLWQSAGWQIARNPIAVVDDQIPADCTLYPHAGVEDQWIGSCSGYTLIPKEGASHIQVMHTPPDGEAILVQVAPTPDK